MGTPYQKQHVVSTNSKILRFHMRDLASDFVSGDENSLARNSSRESKTLFMCFT